MSGDGGVKLYDGVKIGCRKEGKGKGVMVRLNEGIGWAGFIRKRNTRRRDWLKCVEDG